MPRLAALLTCIAATFSLASGCRRSAPVPVESGRSTAAEVELRVRAVERGLVAPNSATAPASAASSIQERMRHYRVPGVSVAVIAGGRIEWARGYGVRQAGGTTPVDTATLFQAASSARRHDGGGAPPGGAGGGWRWTMT
jgi:CubicO group peptidase (beta-lactamase class C family)